MTFIKNTFEILWTIWCLFIAGFFLLINLPILMLFALIFGEGKNNIVDAYLRFWAKLTLIFWGIRLVIIRDKKIDANTPYIYLSNHRSYLDVFIAVAGIKKQKKFLGKAEVFQWPYIGYFARKFGHISVQRESEKARKESYQNLLKITKSDSSIFLCPEGAVYMNEKLLNEMRNGAFRIAIESKTPVVAISMINAGELFPPHKIRIRPGKCINYMSAPFETSALTLDDVDTLRESVKEEILNNLKKHYPQGKYPIEFDPKDYTESVYLNTHKETE